MAQNWNAAAGWLRDGGTYVGVRPGQEAALERGIRIDVLDVCADGAQLADPSPLAH
ncbi:hypothetical protein ABZ733_00840 [Streptomyces longwoodensis]|uniref:hypothetical protein n=1 Tax=Streptomyces longwoodensis TaxID=68231 RepID=UPI0033CAB35D